MTKRIEARTKSQKKARALAVSYQAFGEAYDAIPSIYSETNDDRLNALMVWGRSLLSAQKDLGFEMYRTSLIEDAVARAAERREVLARAERAKMEGVE